MSQNGQERATTVSAAGTLDVERATLGWARVYKEQQRCGDESGRARAVGSWSGGGCRFAVVLLVECQLAGVVR